MYFITIAIAILLIIIAVAVETSGVSILLSVLSIIMLGLSGFLIFRDYKNKKNKNSNYVSQFSDITTPKIEQKGYGYSLENPIFTSSVHNCYVYLDSLKTIDGKKITYKRVGAVYGVQIGQKTVDAVDKYEIKVGGKYYTTLYFCGYGKDSEDVPAGFMLKSASENQTIQRDRAIANSSNESITKLCDGLEKEPGTMEKAFPGGERQKKSIVRSLVKLINITAIDELLDINGDRFSIPPLCTCCLTPTENKENVRYSMTTQHGNIKTTRSIAVDMPICNECLKHRKKYKWLLVLICSISIIIGGIVFAILTASEIDGFLNFIFSVGSVVATYCIVSAIWKTTRKLPNCKKA